MRGTHPQDQFSLSKYCMGNLKEDREKIEECKLRGTHQKDPERNEHRMFSELRPKQRTLSILAEGHSPTGPKGG